jgi:hypothetical protein
MKAMTACIALSIAFLWSSNCVAAEASKTAAASKAAASQPGTNVGPSPIEGTQLGTASRPLVIQKAAEPFDDEEQGLKRRDSFVLGFSLAVTAIALLVAAWQAFMFRRQLVMMREASEDTAKAANAAKEGADVSREALVMAQRAWICFVDIEFQPYGNRDRKFYGVKVAAVLRNTGPTPASVEVSQTGLFVIPKGDDGSAFLKPEKTPPDTGIAQVGPGAPWHTLSRQASEAELKPFFDGESSLIFYLYIAYTDVFDQKRMTQIAYRCVLGVAPADIVSGRCFKSDWDGPRPIRWEPFGKYSEMT